MKRLSTLLETFVKKFVNFLRLPGLLSFIVTKEGKPNPTLKETFAEAPKENWDRMQLGKKVVGKIAVWMIFAILLYLIYKGEIGETLN